MARNLVIIAILAVIFAGLLYLKPWKSTDLPPRFFDRLPEETIVGKTDILELSKMLQPAIFKSKAAFRDFVTPEFILSQGKGYGLDIQSPVYFFANEKGKELSSWGIMISVKDSSKVRDGIDRIRKVLPMSDSVFSGQRVYYNFRQDITLAYGKDWLLICKDKPNNSYLNRVMHAKLNGISPRWRNFLNLTLYNDKHLSFQVISEPLQKNGLQSILVGAASDSSMITLHTCVTQFDSLSFELRNTGPSLEGESFTNSLVNVHLSIDKLRERPNDPIYLYLQKLGKKVSFPLQDFLNAWEGDLAFRQGGIQVIQEQYIESEFDENFNITEVTKYKDVKISGFALYLSMNENGKDFINKLFAKGIITKDSNKFRLLFSPPIFLSKNDHSLSFYTSRFAPKMSNNGVNGGMVTINQVPVNFYLDSTLDKSLHGRITFPIQRFIPETLSLQ